jgi:hypothetical protein
MAKKIDPLNKKQYGAVSAMLTVSDVKAAVAFYQKAFGFARRGVMNGPDGKPIHAELTLRGTTLMWDRKTPRAACEAPRQLAPRRRVCISTWKMWTKRSQRPWVWAQPPKVRSRTCFGAIDAAW